MVYFKRKGNKKDALSLPVDHTKPQHEDTNKTLSEKVKAVCDTGAASSSHRARVPKDGEEARERA